MDEPVSLPGRDRQPGGQLVLEDPVLGLEIFDHPLEFGVGGGGQSHKGRRSRGHVRTRVGDVRSGFGRSGVMSEFRYTGGTSGKGRVLVGTRGGGADGREWIECVDGIGG
jgi:hypothetical protein